MKDTLIALLTDLSFLEARARRFGLEAALADVRYASLYLPNLEPETKDRLSDVAAKVSSQFLNQSVGISNIGARNLAAQCLGSKFGELTGQ